MKNAVANKTTSTTTLDPVEEHSPKPKDTKRKGTLGPRTGIKV